MKPKSEPNPIDDGGYAFPFNGYQWTEHGMSLRDWFAGMAMQGMVGAPASREAKATSAYALADAMIKARQVKGD
jgi:hypothetical protein